MSLSELMSSMGLALYPTMALVLFLGVFVAVLAKLVIATPDAERHAALPLEQETVQTRTKERS